MEKFRVLIVDDEVDFVETIVKRLIDRGLEVAGVHSGPQEGHPAYREARQPNDGAAVMLPEDIEQERITELEVVAGKGC